MSIESEKGGFTRRTFIAASAAALVGLSAGTYLIFKEPTKALPVEDFLNTLDTEQKKKCVFSFDDEERFNWHYTPLVRKGISLKELDSKQKQSALRLLHFGLSSDGYAKATNIMMLEEVLREIESSSFRDPELYYFTFFGNPSDKSPWGWRIEGHHLSLNYTVVNGEVVAASPSFFGANPAEVRQGKHKGLRVLAKEEDLARNLVLSLDEKRRETAIFETNALPDIVSTDKFADLLKPSGIDIAKLNLQQTELLKKLVGEYANSMHSELAAQRMKKSRMLTGKISFLVGLAALIRDKDIITGFKEKVF